MSRQKRTRPDAATSERAGETGPVSQTAPHLHNHDTTAPPQGQALHIADFLSPGMAYAIPLRDLVSITGLRERDLRRRIEQERRAGALIVSDNRRGYWLADDPAEAQWFARSMQHRAREILRTAQAIEGAAGIGK